MTFDDFTIIGGELEAYYDDILRLWSGEWWAKNRSPEDLLVILANSTFTFGLVDLKTKKLVGFARVLTDRFKYAYIYDFILDPSFRKRKLGKHLLTHILEHPTVNKMQCVELTCHPEMIPFYEKFGFSADYSPTVAMRKRKPSQGA